MSKSIRISEILNLINAPAFSVFEGNIDQCNDAAQRMLLTSGTPITSLLQQNQTDYLEFKRGCLYTTIFHNGQLYSTSVVRVEDTNIFILDDESENMELGTLSLTAANLRQPLASMIAATNNLTASLERNEDPRVRTQLREMNRNLCRIHRMLCNMSDAVMYSNGSSSHMICADVVSVVEEVFQKSQRVCSNCGIRLEYTVPNERILCVIDEDLLERSVYNMISNAIKFSDEGSVVKAELTTRDQRIYISVQDQGTGIPPSVLNNIFKRYQREPGIEEGRIGLGLGLVLVRSAAKIHKGLILIDQPDQVGTRVTLSFPIRQNSTAMLRSTITRIDYASGWDHSLLELSDVLPSSLY